MFYVNIVYFYYNKLPLGQAQINIVYKARQHIKLTYLALFSGRDKQFELKTRSGAGESNLAIRYRLGEPYITKLRQGGQNLSAEPSPKND